MILLITYYCDTDNGNNEKKNYFHDANNSDNYDDDNSAYNDSNNSDIYDVSNNDNHDDNKCDNYGDNIIMITIITIIVTI